MRWEIEVGEDLVAAFARLTADRSSIHVDPEFARKTRFRGVIVHGMLPVLLLLRGIYAEERPGGRVWLKALSCRFTEPVKAGDRLRFDAEPQVDGDVETWSFSITRSSSGGRATGGKAVLVRSVAAARPAVAHAGTLLVGRIDENRSTLADLAVGQGEDLTFDVEPLASGPLLDTLALQTGAHGPSDELDDAAAMAVIMASTLIGMRLPGRHATFLDLDAAFPKPMPRDARVTLRGTVADIAPTGSRMRLDLDWIRDSEVVGRGSASTMIGTAAASSLSCADIRRDHGGPGIAGRTALVTGASRGIGEATAKLLAMHGARVAVHYFRGRADAEAIVDDIRGNGGRAVSLQADLADQTSVEALVAAAEAALGPVDILVNNAVGEFTPKPFDEIRAADYMAELGVSLFGLHSCCRQVLGHMRRQRWGKIINLGTVATEAPVTSQTRYIAVKSAVVGHTRSLAVETAADNIQVNMVVPAMTETSLIAGLPRALLDRLAEDSPGAALLQPIDVAKTILFLASDWSGAISGQQILLTRGAPPFL
jgi:3-oxoacyl-[acyl-carrier protein] reductase